MDSRCQLAVAENYRRSPGERARSWAVAEGRIGRPRTFYWVEAGLELGKWGWRNFRREAGGGWLLDGGVHFVDLFRYLLGAEARQVTARVRSFEPYRYDRPVEREGAWPVDVEDSAMALIDFDGGVEDSIATELKEFADAARGRGVPEVDGLEGYRSQAICMAVLESEWFKRPVTLAEIEAGDLEGYQAGIDEALGIR